MFTVHKNFMLAWSELSIQILRIPNLPYQAVQLEDYDNKND